MTDLDLLRRAGTLLYGPNWQRALARGLEVNERTARRWAAGDSPVPGWAWGAIAERLTAQRRQLGAVGRSMRSVAREARARAKD